MGFAGQIFAARVAVGLAMPSPSAMSQAGAVVGGFASKMYQSLNKKSTQAAKKQLTDAQSNLSQANQQLLKHTKSQDSFLAGAGAKAVGRLRKLYGKLGKSAVASASAIKGMKSSITSGATKTKLFTNVSSDMKSAKDYENMMKNFVNLSERERKGVMEAFDARKLALAGMIEEAKSKGKAGEAAIVLYEEELRVIKLQENEFKHYHKVRTNADAEYAADHKKSTSKVKKATKSVKEAQDNLNKINEMGIHIQEKMIAGASAFVIEMKTNFIDALKESISILTAFYYKLNQNTQELIEFERELMNANSVFGVTRDELFTTGDTVVQFGQRFGLEMQNGATGLYQLASAGLSAAESMEVLTETLKLSMAVQGDHNTISKLVTQTLFGFDMEMNQAAIIADKFAFAIQKSLIEYQDLASAVKFALPFFTTTGQSIDQLLGALQVLTNRALEAGIAGRGLRQGLAELAESIGDNTARFREFGIEVTDAQGNMLQLTEIAANFSNVLQAGVINDTELLTTLIEDLNVRGATAFVHLVQASDEFTEAVEATANAGGQLDEMVRIQNESISAQIQILKNNVGLMFLWRDATYEGTEYLNAFHKAVLTTVESLREILVVERDGVIVLTAFGEAIQKLAIEGIKEMRKMLDNVLPLLDKFVQIGALGVQVFKIYLIPIKLLIGILDKMGPTMAKVLISFHLMNKLLPITSALNYAVQLSFMRGIPVKEADAMMTDRQTVTQGGYSAALFTNYLINNLSIKGLYKRITLGIYALTIGKLRLFLEKALIVEAEKKVVIHGMEIPLALKLMHIEGQTVRQLIWSNILLVKNNLLSKIKAFLVRKNMKAYMLRNALSKQDIGMRTVKLHFENLSIKALIKRWIIETKLFIQSKLQLAFDRAKVTMDYLLYAIGLQKYTLSKAQTAMKRKSYVWKLRGLILDRYQAIQETILHKLKKIGFFLNKKEQADRQFRIAWKEYELFLAQRRAAQRKKEFWMRARLMMQKIKDTAIDIFQNIVDMVKLVLKKALNAAMYIGAIILYPLMIVLKGAKALATIWENSADLGQFLITVATNIAKFIYNALTIIAVVVTIAVTAATWLFTAALLANPIGLIVVAVALLIIGLVVLAVKMREQFDIWTIFKMIVGHFIGMLLWPFKIVAKLFMFIGEKVAGVLEGPLFKLALFIGHFFKMLMYYVKAAGTWFMEHLITPIANGLSWVYNSFIKPYLIDPLVNLFSRIKGFLETLRNPLTVMWGFLRDKILTPIWNFLSNIWGVVKDIVGGIASVASGVVGTVASWVGLQQGGYIQMAQQGAMGGGPYLVGEAGPELFVPQGPGKVIPNKDLNTQRVKNMLSDYTAPGAGADKAFQRLGTQSIVVESLEVRKANLKQSRLGIDSFGGYM